MSRILRRPMFRMGGSTGTGIMSGLDKPRERFAEGTTKERLLKAIGEKASPVPQFLTQFGLNLLSQPAQSNIFQTAATAAKKPTQTLFDDIRKRKALESQVGLTAEKLDIGQEQALALKALELGQKQVRTLTEPEVKALKLPEGSIVQQDSQGKINVISKPSAKEIEKRADFKSTIGLLNKIEQNYYAADKPVGPFYNIDPDRIAGAFGQLTGSEKGKLTADLEADIKKTTVFLTKAISGAQVSDKEREFIMKLIPQTSDTEVQFERKLKSLRSYLADAAKNYGGDVEALMKAGVSAKNYLPANQKNLEDLTDKELKEIRDKLIADQTNQEQQP